jgi:dienelactone hydrolase
VTASARVDKVTNETVFIHGPVTAGQLMTERVYGGLVGTLFLPETAVPTPAVICLAGAAGGIPAGPAAALAKEGFAAFALGTHAVEGRPPVIERFPLEYCFAAVGWLRETVKPESGFVAVRGHSRGGQLALLMAVLQPDDVDAVLAYNSITYVSLAGSCSFAKA